MTKSELAIQTFLDCFGGADGGVSFVKFRGLMEEMEKKATKGDEGAYEIIERVHAVSRLIEYASNL